MEGHSAAYRYRATYRPDPRLLQLIAGIDKKHIHHFCLLDLIPFDLNFNT